MNDQNKKFVENVDEWIKEIRREAHLFKQEYDGIPDAVIEILDNVDHNYQLIYDLKQEIEEMKAELASLKLIQIVSLKKQLEIK